MTITVSMYFQCMIDKIDLIFPVLLSGRISRR
jgi:hypothetical protein